MKKFLLAIGVIGCLALPKTYAMDFCCPTECNPCCTDFNGFYFGGNIGVFSHTGYRNDLDGVFGNPSERTFIDTKFTGGLQLGYDWQCNTLLFGVVGDWNWTNGEKSVDAFPDDPTVASYIRDRERWFSTIRLRTGITLCDALFYVTGGAAVTRFRDTIFSEVFEDTAGLISVNDHRTRWGWTGGFGTEFLLGCNWSLGAEFLYLQFSQDTRSFATGTTFGTVDFSTNDSAWVGRIMLNYRFGNLFGCN